MIYFEVSTSYAYELFLIDETILSSWRCTPLSTSFPSPSASRSLNKLHPDTLVFGSWKLYLDVPLFMDSEVSFPEIFYWVVEEEVFSIDDFTHSIRIGVGVDDSFILFLSSDRCILFNESGVLSSV